MAIFELLKRFFFNENNCQAFLTFLFFFFSLWKKEVISRILQKKKKIFTEYNTFTII